MVDTNKATERNAKRMLAAMYRLAKGTTTIAVSKADIFAEIQRESLFDMSDEQFKAYQAKIADEVNTYRATQPESAE